MVVCLERHCLQPRAYLSRQTKVEYAELTNPIPLNFVQTQNGRATYQRVLARIQLDAGAGDIPPKQQALGHFHLDVARVIHERAALAFPDCRQEMTARRLLH